MNRKRLEQLANDLETSALPKGFTFNMATILDVKGKGPDCGSAGCMIGFTHVKYLGATPGRSSYDGHWDFFTPSGDYVRFSAAQDYYELSDDQYHRLFFSCVNSHITPQQAASVVREFIRTGHISWTPVRDALFDNEGIIT